MSSRSRRRHDHDSHHSFGNAIDQNSQSLLSEILINAVVVFVSLQVLQVMSTRHTHQVTRTSLEMRLSMRFLITCQPSCHTGEAQGLPTLGSGLNSFMSCWETSITSCWCAIVFLAFITRTMDASTACFLTINSQWGETS